MNIPDEEHWAIITVDRIYIPGDERSRTNPGHGYPEHYEETINYRSFTSWTDFCNEVTQLTNRNKKFKAVSVKPLKVETTVTVKMV